MIGNIDAEEVRVLGGIETAVTDVVLGDRESQPPPVEPEDAIEIAVAQNERAGNAVRHLGLQHPGALEGGGKGRSGTRLSDLGISWQRARNRDGGGQSN